MTEERDFESVIREAVAAAKTAGAAAERVIQFGGAWVGLHHNDPGCAALVRWFQRQAGVKRGADADGWWGRVRRGDKQHGPTYGWTPPDTDALYASQVVASCNAACKVLVAAGINASVRDWVD